MKHWLLVAWCSLREHRIKKHDMGNGWQAVSCMCGYVFDLIRPT